MDQAKQFHRREKALQRSRAEARLTMRYSLSARQCRAARISLGWNQARLASRSRLARKTIADFERDAHSFNQRTVRDLRLSLERGGIDFIDADALTEGLRWSIATPTS